MFEAYLKHSSAGDFVRCAEMVHQILDLPSKTLLKDGRVPEIQHALAKEMKRFTQFMAPSSLPEQQQAAVDEQSPQMGRGLSDPLTQPFSRSSTVLLQSASSSTTATEMEDSSFASPEEPAEQPDETLEKNIRRAVNIMREGAPRAMTRAVRALMRGPRAQVTDETVRQLRELHPQSNQPLKPLPRNKAIALTAIDKSLLFKLLKRRCNNGAEPGPSGWTGSHLQLIVDQSSEEAKSGVAMLIRDICNGVFGGGTQKRLLAFVLMPISKAGRPDAIRPIAMGELFVKLAAHYSMHLIEAEMPRLFPRIQFGVKRAGGSEAAAHLTRALTAQSILHHFDTIGLATDFANAFNTSSRAKIWETILQHPTTEPMWRMFHWAYASSSPLLVYSDGGRLHIQLESSDGMRQGDPFAGFGFSLGVQPLWEYVVPEVESTHGVSIQDDLSIIGPQAQVFAAYDRLLEKMGEHNLRLRVDKCAVYIPPTLADPSTVALIQ